MKMKMILLTFVSISWLLAPWPVVQSQNRFRNNGETIYYTGTNQDGLVIPFDEGPKWLKRRRNGCVACHGPHGQGRLLIWPTLRMAPDIRYDSLVKEEHSHGGKGEIHPKYTDELIKRAITRGINAEGKSLDPVMPRWKLSNEDFMDLLAYLKQLSKGITPPPEPFPREP